MILEMIALVDTGFAYAGLKAIGGLLVSELAVVFLSCFYIEVD